MCIFLTKESVFSDVFLIQVNIYIIVTFLYGFYLKKKQDAIYTI